MIRCRFSIFQKGCPKGCSKPRPIRQQKSSAERAYELFQGGVAIAVSPKRRGGRVGELYILPPAVYAVDLFHLALSMQALSIQCRLYHTRTYFWYVRGVFSSHEAVLSTRRHTTHCASVLILHPIHRDKRSGVITEILQPQRGRLSAAQHATLGAQHFSPQAKTIVAPFFLSNSPYEQAEKIKKHRSLQFAEGEKKKEANFPIHRGRQKNIGAFSYSP